MEAFKECTTGVLIDLDSQESIEMEQLSVASLHLHESDETPHIQEDTMRDNKNSIDPSSLGILGKFNDRCLETVLKTENQKLPTSKSGWETPSPQSMKRITKEACKIIDQLPSPIDSIEALLDDEEFPVPDSSDEGCFDEFSQDCEKLGTDEDSYQESIFFATIHPFTLQDCEKSGTDENSYQESISCATIHPVTLQATTNVVHSDSEFISTNLKKKTELIQSSAKQSSNSSKFDRISNSKHLKHMLSKTVAKTKNISKNSDFKTPVKSSEIINKENESQKSKAVSTGMRYSKNCKNISGGKILSDANDCKMAKPKCNVEKSLNTSKVAANISQRANTKQMTPQDTSTKKSFRSSNILSRLTGSKQSLPVSCQKSAFSKNTSMVITPTVSKSVHRTSSLQTEKAQHSSTIKKEPCLGQKSFLSNEDSLKKNVKSTTGSSVKPAKPRMFDSHIPTPGIPYITPFRRSNSLSKVSTPPTTRSLQRSYSALTASKISQISRQSSTRCSIPTADVFKKPAASTSSRIRFKSRLFTKSTLPPEMNDNLPRELFPTTSKIVKKANSEKIEKQN